MKVKFEGGSSISFAEAKNGVSLTMTHKKANGTYSASSFVFNKSQAVEIAQFLIKYLEDNANE